MARVLYLVAGEGNGHATRSAAVIDSLHGLGHEVAVVSDGQALEILENSADRCLEAVTPHIMYRNNAVRGVHTLWKNLAACPVFVRDFLRVKNLVSSWRPQVVVSDFNPMGSWIRGIPLVSIDNQGLLSQAKIVVPQGLWWEYIKSRMVCAVVVPWATVRVVSFFTDVPVRMDVVKVGPIVSKKVKSLQSHPGKHVVVYQTSPSHSVLYEILPQMGIDVVAYGFGKSGKDGRVVYKSFNANEWYTDLSSCRAVIMNGGYSLMTEALVLGKPALCFPVRHQFEQALNAYYLEKEGLGVWGKEVSVKEISDFLEKEMVIRQRLKKRVWSDGAAQAAKVVDDVLLKRV